MNLLDTFLREPVIAAVQDDVDPSSRAAAVGTLRLNMDDVRALMIALQDLTTEDGAGGTKQVFPRVHVLTVGGREYGADELDQLVSTQWIGAGIICRREAGDDSMFGLALWFNPRERMTLYAPVPEFLQVTQAIERAWSSRELRQISYLGRRRLAVAAGLLGLAMLWAAAVVWGDPHPVTAALAGVLTGLVAWLVASKIFAAVPSAAYGLPPGGVTVVATSQAVMDQRRHDRHQNGRLIFWTLVISVPLSGIGGTLLAHWLR
jgi:hypothetical protein